MTNVAVAAVSLVFMVMLAAPELIRRPEPSDPTKMAMITRRSGPYKNSPWVPTLHKYVPADPPDMENWMRVKRALESK